MDPEYKYYFKNDLRTLSSLSLHEVACLPCPADHTISFEKTGDYGLYCVVEGKGVYTFAGKDLPVKAGQCFAVYPGAGDPKTAVTPAFCRADTALPWTLCWVCFDGADARLLLNAAAFSPESPVRTPPPEVVDGAVRAISGIYAYRGQLIHSLVQSTALLYTMFAYFIKAVTWEPGSLPPGWAGTFSVKKALDYIAENYSRPITVTDIAAHINLSRGRLYKIFLEHLFRSPQQYLTEFRIREACNLLEKRSGSVKEISYAVGFNDPLYFSTMFKQVTGKSPTLYVRELA
jgi:AraC-like DNA-binding protein